MKKIGQQSHQLGIDTDEIATLAGFAIADHF